MVKKEKYVDRAILKEKLQNIRRERAWNINSLESPEVKKAVKEKLEGFKKETKQKEEERVIERKIKQTGFQGKISKLSGKINNAYDKFASSIITNRRVINRRILKKQPRATYVIKTPEERGSSFQKAWNRENLLGWN